MSLPIDLDNQYATMAMIIPERHVQAAVTVYPSSLSEALGLEVEGQVEGDRTYGFGLDGIIPA